MDKRDYILSCFTQNDDLTAFLYSAMADYTAGNRDDGDAKMTCSKSYFAEALQKCDETSSAFLTAEHYYANFDQQDNADEIRQQNYEKNKVTIDRDIGYITQTWNTGVFFNSGFFAGEAQGLLEGYPTYSSE